MIAARPPAGLTELPPGWHWWVRDFADAPARDDILRTREGDLLSPDDAALVAAARAGEIPGQVVRHSAAHFSRQFGRQALSGLAHELAACWGSDDARTAALMAVLPRGWRRWALRKRGYTAKGHNEIVGPPVNCEDSATQTAAGEPADDGFGPWTGVPEEWEIARAPWLRIGAGRWAHPGMHIARAPDGTGLPAGWQQIPDPAPHAPVHVSAATAQNAAGVRYLPSELSTVTVTEQPSGRWSYGLGTAGHLRVLGERPTAEAAVAAGTAAHAEAAGAAWERFRGKFGDDLSWTGLPPAPPAPHADIRAREAT